MTTPKKLKTFKIIAAEIEDNPNNISVRFEFDPELDEEDTSEWDTSPLRFFIDKMCAAIDNTKGD